MAFSSTSRTPTQCRTPALALITRFLFCTFTSRTCSVLTNSHLIHSWQDGKPCAIKTSSLVPANRFIVEGILDASQSQDSGIKNKKKNPNKEKSLSFRYLELPEKRSAESGFAPGDVTRNARLKTVKPRTQETLGKKGLPVYSRAS